MFDMVLRGSRALLLSSTMLVSVSLPQAHAQTFSGSATTSGPFGSGVQTFYDSSTLNASTANAVSGGNQVFNQTSTLNASAANAVSGGTQVFYASSTLTASAANAISGGNQVFYGNSALTASAASAVSGGYQFFFETNTLTASAANAVNGGTQAFYQTSTLTASAASAVSGGVQSFIDTSTLTASAASAVSGGVQSFNGTNALTASAASAVSGGTQTFYGNSVLNVQADNALTTGTSIRFNTNLGGTGGTMRLNGYSTVVGGITSEVAGSGVITNGAAGASILTVDTSQRGPSIFSGRIEDGGAGALGLTVAGGELTFAGTTTHTGGTIVSGGKLLVGDAAGNGTLGGTVTVGTNGTLGGSGTLTGPVTIDGTLSAGNSPGTLTFDDSLTLNAGSTSVFELNSPGMVGGTGGGGNDLVVVNGNLALGGTLDARVAAAGYYRLFNYGGSLTGDFGNVALTGTGGFVPVSSNINTGPGQVNLAVVGAGQTLQFWDGADSAGNGAVNGGHGVWSTNGTNWTGQPGQAAINGSWAGSVAVFAGATGGTVTVEGT